MSISVLNLLISLHPPKEYCENILMYMYMYSGVSVQTFVHRNCFFPIVYKEDFNKIWSIDLLNPKKTEALMFLKMFFFGYTSMHSPILYQFASSTQLILMLNS